MEHHHHGLIYSPHKRICQQGQEPTDSHKILQNQDAKTTNIYDENLLGDGFTSCLSGAKDSICLKSCSESTESSQAKMASLILSNGSLRCLKRMAGHQKKTNYHPNDFHQEESLLTDVISLPLSQYRRLCVLLCGSYTD